MAKIESTPVVTTVGAPPIKEIKSGAFIPEGESPPADFANPPNETKGEAASNGDAAGSDGAGSDGAAGDSGAKDAANAADKGAEGDDKAAEAGAGGDDKAAGDDAEADKAKKDLEASSALQKKRFLQLQEEAASVARDKKQLKADRQALDQQTEAQKKKVDAYDNATRLAKDDPVKLLELLGVSYETITQAILNKKDGADPKIAKVEEELAALRAEKEKEKTDKATADEAAVTAQQKANMEAYRNRLREKVDNTEEYTLVKLQGDSAIQQAINAAGLHYQNHGVLPSDEELLAATEDHLVKQATAALGTEKFKKLYPGLAADEKSASEEKPAGDAAESAGTADEKAATEEPAKAAKTLSNEMQGTGGTRKGTGLKDRDASVDEAASLLKWS